MSSILQDWVMELPLRAQGTIIVGLRGCDVTPKSTGAVERQLIAFLRYCALNPADPREIDIPGSFFQSFPPTDWKASAFGHYPEHWYSHLMHAFEVVGYCHPKYSIAHKAEDIYLKFVKNLHLAPESRLEMMNRLVEDRIAANTVVS